MTQTTNRVAELKRPSPDFPRRYLPATIDLGDWASLEAVFNELTSRDIGSPEALEAWLLDVSETFAAISEERSRRYIAMTCDTADPEIEKSYLSFVETVQPKLKTAGFAIEKKLLDHPACAELPSPRYDVMLRSARNQVELFREENIPLETELSRLSQRYQKLCGAMTVDYRGETKTLQQMAVFLQEPDRAVRREAWEMVATRRLQDRAAFDDTFGAMLEIRQQVAQSAGFDNYRDYMFRRMERFDYTPTDCETYHKAVEEIVVPAYRKSLALRAEAMGFDPLRPWDIACDPYGRPPLRPFDGTEKLVTGCRRIFGRIDPSLGKRFDLLIDNGLLDLDSRVGKAPGGYQSSLEEVRLPFIFMNAVGMNRDVMTLLHEGGHAFHSLLARHEPLCEYRHAPMEFCEVASMSMELIGGPFMDEFYGPAELARAGRERMDDVLMILPWVATVDAFQHWIYTHPGHTPGERNEKWVELVKRFGAGPMVDYSGYDDAQRWGWHRQLHIFQVPFYYIEYGIAQLGALQIWMRAKHDRAAAIAGYQNALTLGGSRPLPELFEAAGIRFDFGPATIKPLIDEVLAETERMAEAEKSA